MKEPRSQKDQVLQRVGVFLLTLHKITADGEVKKAIKAHADLCWISLPNCYRLTKEDRKGMGLE